MPWLGRFARAAGIAVVLAMAWFLLARQPGELSVQSWKNVHFARNPSLVNALRSYPTVRPPLYPTVLWAAARVGGRPYVANALLLSAVILGLFALCRREAPSSQVLFPVLAFALGHFNAVNYHQFTAEALVTPLLLVLVWLIARYRVSGSDASALGIAVTVSLLCLSRIFSLYSVFPVALINLLLLSPRGWRRRVFHGSWIGILAGSPMGIWMVLVYRKTGFWTGADRTSPREFPGAIEGWEQLITFTGNIRLTVKTLWIDFFSPTRYAAHSVVTRPYDPSRLEWVLAGLLVVVIVVALRQFLGRSGALSLPRLCAFWYAARSSPVLVAFEWVVAYLAATIAIWTLGNNDPIYTRFLFPVYPLLILVAFGVYRRVAQSGGSFWVLAPFRAVYLGFVAVQVARHFLAESFPARYVG